MPVLTVGGAKSFGANEAIVMRNAANKVTELVLPDAGHWLMGRAAGGDHRRDQVLLEVMLRWPGNCPGLRSLKQRFPGQL